jgi:glycosyltransferase involved in cell wall biosynthesis
MLDQKRSPSILQIISRLGGGGAPLQVILLSRGLNNASHRTRIVTGHCAASECDMSYILTPSDPVEWIPSLCRQVSLVRDLRAVWDLYQLIRMLRPTIVHTHTAKAGALGRIAATLAGVPVVVHTYHGHIFSGYYSPLVSLVIRFAERLLARITTGVCVLSPQQFDDVTARFGIAPRDRVAVIPLGLDLKRFRAIPLPKSPAPMLTVGWLGRLVPVKNIRLLLDVVAETLRRTDHVRFIIAGDGPDRALIEGAVGHYSSDRVRWVGWQEDVSGVIAECHCLIQTSRNEGTPIGLIEGMAAGRPFISTPAGGVVDMVSGPGDSDQAGCRWFDNAVLVDPDPSAFGAALCGLLANPDLLVRMGQAACSFSINRYDIDGMTNNYLRLYMELQHRVGKRVTREARNTAESRAR